MIDYIKLKIAHELACKYSKETNLLCSVDVCFNGENITYHFHYGEKEENNLAEFYYTYSIDDLINKLKELTQPKPKYQLREIVWLFNYERNEIDCFKIDAISTKTLTYSGECINSSFIYEEIPEKDLYPSREALIDAQIAMWQKMKEEL